MRPQIFLSLSSSSLPFSPFSSYSSLFNLASTTSLNGIRPVLNRCSHCYYSSSPSSPSSSFSPDTSIPFPKHEISSPSIDIATPEKAEEYLQSLRSGTLVNGSKWDYFFKPESSITTDQAYELLTFGRQAKLVTAKRYYSYLHRLASSNEYIPFHTALSAMVHDNVRLKNHSYYMLARTGFKDPNLITRCTSQIDFSSPDSIQLIPELVRMSQFACAAIIKSSAYDEAPARILRFINRMPKKILGAPLYNIAIKYFNDRRDMAMNSAVYKDMLQRQIPLDMKSYELLVRGVERREFLNILQDLKTKNIVPSIILYTKILERLCERNKDTLFLRTLQEMTDNKVTFDLYAYSTAIKGSLHYGHIDTAITYLRQMIQERVFPDRGVIDLLISAFEGKPEEISNIEQLWEQVAIQREQAKEDTVLSTREVLPVLDEEW